MTDTDPAELPGVIRTYLAAHAVRDTDTALQSFAADAVVLDDGHRFGETDEIRTFLQKAGSQFRYTTELVGTERIDEQHWVVRNRLKGDFPGGVVDLAYRFTIDDDLITELVIGV